MRAFPREVVISANYGAGLVTWWHEFDDFDYYDIIEHPAFINAIHDGYKDELTIKNVLENAGFPENVIHSLYMGGLRDAVVVTVTGPYKVVEYDGYESIEYRDAAKWRD